MQRQSEDFGSWGQDCKIDLKKLKHITNEINK
jgi:hypothetical protein